MLGQMSIKHLKTHFTLLYPTLKVGRSWPGWKMTSNLIFRGATEACLKMRSFSWAHGSIFILKLRQGWGLEISFFMILKRCDASKDGRHKFSSLAHKSWLRRPFCGWSKTTNWCIMNRPPFSVIIHEETPVITGLNWGHFQALYNVYTKTLLYEGK